MSLLEELVNKRAATFELRENRRNILASHQSALAAYDLEIAELDIAIAALTPAPPTVSKSKGEEGGRAASTSPMYEDGDVVLLDSQPLASDESSSLTSSTDAAGTVELNDYAQGYADGVAGKIVDIFEHSTDYESGYDRGLAGLPFDVSDDEVADEVPEQEGDFDRGVNDGFAQSPAGPEPQSEAYWDGYKFADTAIIMDKMRAESQPQQPATPIPEGFTKWEGAGYEDAPHCKDVEVLFRDGRRLQGVSGEFTWSSAQQLLDAGWKHSDAEGGKIDPADDIIAYRIIETGAPPSELDSSQIEGDDRVENLHDQPKLTDKQYESLEPLPADKPSTVFLDQAEAAINDRIEDDASYAPVNNTDQPATTEQLEAAGIIDPAADDFAKGLLRETEAKAEPRKFGGIFGFGAKKTLVGEGV